MLRIMKSVAKTEKVRSVRNSTRNVVTESRIPRAIRRACAFPCCGLPGFLQTELPYYESVSVSPVFGVDLNADFVLIYVHCLAENLLFISGGILVATKTNFILKVQDAKLADVQKALKDANITVVSIMEIHKEEA